MIIFIIIINPEMAETKATIVTEVAASLGFTLRDKQMETICAFIEGRDVFCCLPTGFGKSLCYAILPNSLID